MKRTSGRLANLTPEQREKLFKKLREQKAEQKPTSADSEIIPIESFSADENQEVLSFAQQRIWFLDHLISNQATYNIPCKLQITGKLNVTALEKAFHFVLNRHQVLRTNYINDDGLAKIIVREADRFNLVFEDISQDIEKEQSEKIEASIEEEAFNPFSLANDSLIRAKLFAQSDENHVLLITVHHIISDAWSMTNLVKEISSAYSAFLHDKEPELPVLQVQYSDFAAWQRQFLNSDLFSRQIDFWKENLQGIEVLRLPYDFSRPPSQTFNGKQKVFELNESITGLVRDLAKKQNKTLFMVLLAAWNIFLFRYSSQTDFAVGVPVANRKNSLLEPLIGNFLNSLAIRTSFRGDESFYDLLDKVHKNSINAYENQDVPFELLIDELGMARDVSQSSIFQNMFSFHSESIERDFDFPDLMVSMLPIHTRTAKFDLAIDVVDQGKTMKVSLEFNTGLFEEETIEQMARHFKTLLEEVLKDPGKNIQALDMLSAEEKQAIFNVSSGKQVAYPAYSNVIDFLADHAGDQSTALSFEGQQLSYKALHMRSDKLAVYLQSQNISVARSPVGLCFDRGIDMVVALLAVLKAGSPYLPIDPELPQDRVEFMLKDSEAILVLCNDRYASRFENSINLDNNAVQLAIESCDGELVNPASSQDLFTIIYTSGSTGKPKGVMVTHEGILNRIQWMQSEFNLKPEHKVLQKTTYSFDVSVWEFIWPLSVGATLVIAKPEGHKDPFYLSRLIKTGAITHCHFVPSMLQSWLLSGEAQGIQSLQQVFCSGEALSRRSVNDFYKLLPQTQLHNLYGPTEASVDVSHWHCEKDAPEDYAVPIGCPISNTYLFVLDNACEMVAPGVAGELHIGGVQLARGYLNREALNNKSFITTNIGGRSIRLYKTGDLVRQRRNGVIDYLGRIDQQVKIRGYRIELGEIESALLSHASVKHCAVLVADVEGAQQLIAYISSVEEVSENQVQDHKATLKKFLANLLPAYMVPSVIMVLDTMPLLSNGKVNRKVLPAPVYEQARYQAPKNDVEKSLAAIWQEVLRIESIGINDNFFELGGDSILSIQIVSAARKKDIVLSPAQLFRFPTIGELSQVAESGKKCVEAEQGQVLGELELAPAQQWFFSNIYVQEGASDELMALSHFCQSLKLDLSVSVSLDQLRLIVSLLIQKHDALSLRFEKKQSDWHAYHRDREMDTDSVFLNSLISEHYVDNHEVLGNTIKGLYSSLAIDKGRLVHFALINQSDSEKSIQSIVLIIHHLVVDGISWRILLDDLDYLLGASSTIDHGNEKVLAQVRQGLPEKTVSYKEWNSALASLLSSDLLDKDKTYWLDLLDKAAEHESAISELKKHRNNSRYSFSNQQRKGFVLDTEASQRFLKQANHSFSTEADDLLLCALLASFSNTAEPASLFLDMESHGRNLSDTLYNYLSMPDVSRTVGWLTHIYPVLLEFSDDDRDWSRRIKSIKEQLRKVPEKGLGFALLSSTGSDVLKMRSTAAISFNYLGQFSGEGGASFRVDSQARNMLNDQSEWLSKHTALDILLFIEDGCLHCDFLYDQKMFSQEKIANYLNEYQTRLEELIDYCCSRNHVYLTPSDLPAALLTQKQIEKVERSVSVSVHHDGDEKFNIESIHALLPTQTGMLFHSIFSGDAPGEHAYFEQFCVELVGDIDADVLQQAWRCTIEKHANLRSTFYWQFDTPLQIVYQDVPFLLNCVDWRAEKSTDKESLLDRFLQKDREQGFILDRLPLSRVSLLQVENGAQWMVWSFHHILLDGWSVPLVLKDVFDAYIAGREKQQVTLLKPLHDFEDFVAWSRDYQAMLATEEQIFWKSQLSGFKGANTIDLEPVAFPIEEKTPRSSDEQCKLELDKNCSEALRSFARTNKLTLNTLIQTAWSILLSYYSGDDDVVFGSTVSGRPEKFSGVEDIVGMFINTLPMRVQLSEQRSLLQCLQSVQNTQQEINVYQMSSLPGIQKMLGMDKDSALFNSILVFENFPVDQQLKESNAHMQIGRLHGFEKTNYPITVSVEPGERIVFRLLFDGLLYRKNTMERLLGHLSCLLENFPGNEQCSVFELPFIPSAERKSLDNWNMTQTTYPRNACLTELVEQQVKQNPEQLALKFDEVSLSYAQLNAQANRLARFLHELGVTKGDRIALFMDRSASMLISALAVVKTGAAYVPLDPAYPRERLEYMLDDCAPRLILSVMLNEEALFQALSGSDNENKDKLLFIDQSEKQWQSGDDSNPDFHHKVASDDLAYLMYTSGSTGQPKGVCLSHRSIIRLVMNTWYLNIGPRDRIGHICNVCFDASAYEIWGALLNGASLIGFDRETLLSEDIFAEKLQTEGVTNMLMTTSLFHLYSRHRPEIFSKMRCLLVGGEPLQPEAARQVLRASKPLHLMNVYGPTENGVLTTVFDTWDLSESARNTPVGKPISNTTVYIVNKRNQELPVGVVGELVSGGDGVGLGYWNKPEMSERSFIRNPFSEQNDARMYRTGDLARRLADGSFEVLGRMDDQLKIRGFRIEPSEIIKRLNQMVSVSDAVVVGLDSEAGKKHLVAYVVAAEDVVFDAQEAKKLLSEGLPRHMLPDFFVEIEHIPITPNGKLDKSSLPKPRFGEQFSDNYAAARNESEAMLVGIWQEVLKLNSIGIYDNFFELGGDSIISIQIVSRAKRAGLGLSPKLLFEYPCIAELSQHVSKANKHVVAEQGMVSGEVKLTPIQHWFFSQDFAKPNHFNQSLLFKVKPFVTIQSITPVLSAVLKHHDALRLRFTPLKGEWLQKHDNSAGSLSSLADILSEKNLSSESDPYQEMLRHSRDIQKQLSITHGPMLKMVLYHLGDSGQRLFIAIHHLVIDGVSWRILLDHLNLALSQQVANQAIRLGEKSTSYQYYARVLHEFTNSAAINPALAFWREYLQGLDSSKVCLTEKQEKASDIKQLRLSIDTQKSHALLHQSHQAYRTEVQDLLALAFALAVHDTKLTEQIYLDMESHGRNSLAGEFAEQLDLSTTVGWFTAIYPLFFDMSEIGDTQNYAALIKGFKRRLHAAAKYSGLFQAIQFLSHDESASAFFRQLESPDISFNYLGQISGEDSQDCLQMDADYLEQAIQLIGDNAEQNKPVHAVSASVAYHSGGFHLTCNYDAVQISEAQGKGLLTHFSERLDALLEHCLDSQHFGFTPEDLPYIDLQQEQLDEICKSFRQQHQGRLDAIYPLSPMQEGMLFHSRLDAASGMYCEQVSVLFEGEMNIKAMEQAWNDAIASHDILRTSFIWDELNKPLQLVHQEARIEIRTLDWRQDDNVRQGLDAFLAQDRAQGFDFAEAPLMRLHYILWPSVNPEKILGRFVWTYHHILLDGWSMPLLMREIFDRYNTLQNEALQNQNEQDNKQQELISQSQQQKDHGYQRYIEWLYHQAANDWVEQNQLSKRQQFWKDYLAGFEEANNLSIGIKHGLDPRSENAEIRFQELFTRLDEEETRYLHDCAANHQVTINTLLQAAWTLLLNRYTGETDIVFGITVSGRPSELSDVESIVGLFINTIPFRVQLDSESKLDEWLKQILKNQIQLRQFETTPLVEIQAQSQVDGSRSLFDSILVFENYPLDETLSHSPQGLNIEDVQIYEQTNFPLSVIVLPGTHLDIKVLYDSHRYERQIIKQMLTHLKTILLELVHIKNSYQTDIQSIAYLSEGETHSIIEDWNNTFSLYPRDSYLQDIVSAQQGDNLALISKQGNMTYVELEQASNKLANYMRSDALGENAIKHGDKVVICINRSNELIVAMLAILKAGAVYVPLDPGYPEERQRYMLEDTQARLIITDADNVALVKHLCVNKALHSSVSYIDIHAKSDVIGQCEDSLINMLSPYVENEHIPAAILYTSGSTGQPKGVCLPHRGLSRMVINTNYMQLHGSDRVAHVSNICFDAASFEVWAALLNGLPLVILDKDIMLDLEKFESSLKENQVTILLITTALFNLVAKERVSAFDNIQYLFFGGEASDARMVRRVLYEAKPAHLMHMYGPSENSTYATWYEVKQLAENTERIPIGKAVSNSQVYIMNQQGDLLPPGVAGEIVCAGDGLALGYLNKPEQSNKAFVMRSLPGHAPERMYVTGDLGVCLPDGNIEILGRIDNQIKIRGHRIEPEEIITRINSLSQIKKAHVLVKEDEDDRKYLVAYYVAEADWLSQQADKTARGRELKQMLKNLMPEYMIPAFYMEIDELPLTPNGKIDSKALPDADSLQGLSEYQAPESELESQLVAIWEEVLGQESVGVNDDFFELGGHSLLATQIHSRIRQQLNIDIPLRTLFELPTIREFSEFWQAVSASQDSYDSDSDNDKEFEEGEL